MFICSLENSSIHFLICVEFLGLKVCGMLSINRIFRLEWEFLKSAGRLFVSDNYFVLDSGGFSVWLMLVLCGDGWFVFWFVDATDIWFDDEWICFNWSVAIEKCEIWFSVRDWQGTDLVGCFMHCKMSIPNVFVESIMRLRLLKNGSALLALIHLFILVIFFIYPWALWVDPLPTITGAYPINFILFSVSCIPYYSRFSFWLIFVTYVTYIVTVFRVTCIAFSY